MSQLARGSEMKLAASLVLSSLALSPSALEAQIDEKAAELRRVASAPVNSSRDIPYREGDEIDRLSVTYSLAQERPGDGCAWIYGIDDGVKTRRYRFTLTMPLRSISVVGDVDLRLVFEPSALAGATREKIDVLDVYLPLDREAGKDLLAELNSLCVRKRKEDERTEQVNDELFRAALRSGDIKAAKQLIDGNLVLRDGRAAVLVRYSEALEDPAMIQYLIERAGADVDFQGQDGVTPIIKAIDMNTSYYSTSEAAATVAVLLRSGADPLLRDSLQRNALHYLAIEDSVELATAFFANIDRSRVASGGVPDFAGCTPWNYVRSRAMKRLFRRHSLRKRSRACREM